MTLHDHGSLSEEAGKLAEILEAWLAGARQSAGAWAAAEPTGEGESLHSPECRVCPICRAMHFVTTMQPDVFAHLADAVTSLAAAVRAMGEAEAGEDTRSTGGQSTAAGFADEPSGEA